MPCWHLNKSKRALIEWWDLLESNPTTKQKLLLLPTVSLAEISRSNGDPIKGERKWAFNSLIFIFERINFKTHYKRWKMIIYMAMSLVLVNISLSSIRIFLIIKFKALKPSRIFLGKNLIFFFVQTLKLCKAVKVSFNSSVYV